MVVPIVVVATLILLNSNPSEASPNGTNSDLRQGRGISARRNCPDYRILLRADRTMNEPFQSAVRLTLRNSRCSGILIGPRHVLTSAHCVHNGTHVTSPLATIRVGIVQASLKRRVLSSYSVDRVFVAGQYQTKPKSAKHDYAVLRLTLPHGKKYMKMEAMSAANIQQQASDTLHFASFPKDKPAKQMWYTSCDSLTVKANVVLSTCTAKSGSSGSGVYVLKKQTGKRVVIGVLSAVKQQNTCTTITTRLRKSKIKEICGWIGQGVPCP